MKVYSKKSVYEKSLERIEWVIREFKGHIVVGSSGGKDSTVVMELALEVIRKLKNNGELPKDYKLKVMWLDQEAEWTRTREYIEDIAKNRTDEIELYWMQCFFELTHSASLGEVNMLRCYDKEYDGVYCQPLSEYAYDRLYVDEKGYPLPISELNKHRKLVNGKWVYDKELPYKEHDSKNFYVIFEDIYSWINGGKSYAVLQGVKASESPRRNLQLTYQLGYKGITWSCVSGKHNEGVRFSPISDWSLTDDFIYFQRSGCKYNKIYDEFLQFGIPPAKMRVSSLIHETSVAHNSTIVQELDRELYNRMCDRLPGISTYSQLQEKAQKVVLPVNFKDYEEYARYLIDTVMVEKNKHYFLEMFESKFYLDHKDNRDIKTELDKCIVESILTKDVDKTKYKNMVSALDMTEKKQRKIEAKRNERENN